MQTAFLTDVGLKRLDNQDRVAITTAPSGSQLLIISDGIGGNQGGSKAAAMTVDFLENTFLSDTPATLDAAKRWFYQYVQTINDQILQTANQDSQYSGMGTTLVAAIVLAPTVVVAHIGDSRAYLLHDDTLNQLMRDHTLVNELVRIGELTPAQAKQSPHQNVITRAVGVSEVAELEVNAYVLGKGDVFMLCSDGLYKEVTSNQMQRIIKMKRISVQEKCHRLIDRAIKAGGADNISVLICQNTPERG